MEFNIQSFHAWKVMELGLGPGSLTVDNGNVKAENMYTYGSEMWQPFGLFSMIFHHLGKVQMTISLERVV